MSSMKTRLSEEHLLSRIFTSTAVDALLLAMQPVLPTPPPADREEGKLSKNEYSATLNE